MTPFTTKSKALRVGVSLAILAVVLLLVLPYLISLERFRPLVVEALERQTGRTVELEALRLRFLPVIGVHLGNLRIKNPRGFPAGNTAVVESVNFGLALGPLLRRQVEIDSVGVDGVQLSLLTNERGENNYESLLVGSRTRSRRRGKVDEASEISLSEIGRVTLGSGTVSTGSFWSGRGRIYPDWELSGLNLVGRDFRLSDPNWHQNYVAEVNLTRIRVTRPGWKEPLRFSSGELRIEKNRAESKFTATLAGARADGTLKVSNLSKPVADFTLTAKSLNLAELGAALSGERSPGPTPGSRGRAQLLARGTLAAEHLAVPPLELNTVSGQVRVYSTRVEVEPFSFRLYGGRAEGQLGVDLTEASLPTSVTARVQGVDVARAVAAASPDAKGRLSGTFEADGRIGTSLGGDSLGSLSGGGRFAVREGTFPGFDLRGALAGMAKLLQVGVPAGDTRFHYFGGDYRISNRRVHSQKLELQSEALEASLGGSFGLDQTLDYSGWGILTGKSEGGEEPSSHPLDAFRRAVGGVLQQTVGQMRVPFVVRGTFQDPKFILAGTPQPVRQPAGAQSEEPAEQQRQKKRSLFDLFKKP